MREVRSSSVLSVRVIMSTDRNCAKCIIGLYSFCVKWKKWNINEIPYCKNCGKVIYLTQENGNVTGDDTETVTANVTKTTNQHFNY